MTNLFQDFPSISKAEWIEKIEKDLKGKTFEELFTQIDEHISMAPIAHADDRDFRPPIAGGKENNDWQIGEDIIVEDYKKANQQVLIALEQGVNAPCFIIKNNFSEKDINVLLENIELSYISTHFILENISENAVDIIINGIKNKNSEASGSIHCLGFSLEQELALFSKAATFLPNFKVLTTEMPVLSATADQSSEELAQTIAKANQYLSYFLSKKIDLQSVANRLQFKIYIGSNYFVEIAKLRALKILWGNVLQAYKLKIELPVINARFKANTQVEDPHHNMIMATTQAMSAVIGGVDRLTVLPSDTINGQASDFSRTTARHLQHILKMESFFDQVVDPAAGSYYVEQLTDALAENAWKKFQTFTKSQVTISN